MTSDEIKSEQRIFTVHEWEQMISTVYKQEQMILQNANFQDLMRNDQKVTVKWRRMTEYEHKISFMTDITCSWTFIDYIFLKQSCPSNIGYWPVMFHPVLFILIDNLSHAFPLTLLVQLTYCRLSNHLNHFTNSCNSRMKQFSIQLKISFEGFFKLNFFHAKKTFFSCWRTEKKAGVFVSGNT